MRISDWSSDVCSSDLVIARDMAVLAEKLGLSAAAKAARFLLVEDDRPGRDRPLSDEKLSLVLTVYRARDFEEACALVRGILDVKGRGHSCGIHTADMRSEEHTSALQSLMRTSYA